METLDTKKEVSLDDLYLKRDEALERVVEIFLEVDDAKEDELNAKKDELNKALDVLTVAHATATFEFASSSFSS
jgi:hypothetical protein